MTQNLPALNPAASKEAKAMHSLLSKVWDGLFPEMKERAIQDFAAINIAPIHEIRQALLDNIKRDSAALKLAESMTDADLDKTGVRELRKMVAG